MRQSAWDESCCQRRHAPGMTLTPMSGRSTAGGINPDTRERSAETIDSIDPTPHSDGLAVPVAAAASGASAITSAVAVAAGAAVAAAAAAAVPVAVAAGATAAMAGAAAVASDRHHPMGWHGSG